MNRREIIEKLIKLINDTFDCDNITEHDLDQPLVTQLEARHLLLLFFGVEKLFNISITEENFEKCGFQTVNKIADLVELSSSSVA